MEEEKRMTRVTGFCDATKMCRGFAIARLEGVRARGIKSAGERRRRQKSKKGEREKGGDNGRKEMKYKQEGSCSGWRFG